MDNKEAKISVQEQGPYLVKGGLKLTEKRQIVSEHGEPMSWQTVREYESKDTVALCRCGHSADKPFCDGSHKSAEWDGSETAPTNTTAERQTEYEDATGIVIKRDMSLCMSSGFCGDRLASIKEMASETDNSIVRARVMAMIERCPSGSYTYSMTQDGDDIEPDMPLEVAATTDIQDGKDVMGALWVSGGVPIERADGKPFETRNRVTLCRCGRSGSKPLCDGSHLDTGDDSNGE